MPDFIGENGKLVNAASLQAALAKQAQARIDGMLARWFGLVPELSEFDEADVKELGRHVI